MAGNFRRLIAVQVGTTRIESSGFGGLECEFRATRHLQGSPNTADCSLYNLSEDDIASLISLPKGTRISCEAGFVNTGRNEVFRGDLQFCTAQGEFPGTVVLASATDGGEAQFKRFYKSYAKGTPLQVVIEDLVKASGLDAGNLSDSFRRYSGLGRERTTSGMVVSGSAYVSAQKLLRPHGFGVSIQSNQVQIREIGVAVAGDAILLNGETGLLGSPSIDNKGEVSFQCEILPDLFPGKQVRIESLAVNGAVDVREAEYVATMRGDFLINGKGKLR